MAYFPDLTPYRYHRDDPGALHVGWLDGSMPYVKGETSPEFHAALLALLERPMNFFRGWHSCNLCGPGTTIEGGYLVRDRNGNGEIRVRREGPWLAAPKLIHHYVTAHDYKPPDEFIAAVLDPVEIGTDENSTVPSEEKR